MKTFLFAFASCIFILGDICAQEIENTNVTICWDNSLSMSGRDLEKDFSVLDSYFKKTESVEVQLLYFNIDVTEKNCTVIKGDWSQLREELQNVIYDGASIFSNLKGKIRFSKVFVFTDGNKLLAKDILPIPEKAFIINSSGTKNATFLERTALINRGRLIDFSKTSTEDLNTGQNGKQNEKKGLLQGTVYIGNRPVSNAKVALKGISDSFFTDESGSFSIPAEVGDTLLVTSRESKTLKIVPVEMMVHTKIFLEANIVSLDEVVVIEERQEQELINTGYALYNKDRLGYEVATISEDEISSIEVTAGDAIRNKVPGVDVSTKNSIGVEGGLAQTEIRGRNSLYMDSNALLVIDGIPKKRSSREINAQEGTFDQTIANHSFIDPANIEKVTVLKGLAATNQWGADGANGVILITTKTAGTGIGPNKKKVDRARLKNNVYEGKESEVSTDASPFLKALESSAKTEEAYDTYLTLREMNRKDINFYLDAFSYFKTKNQKKASRIISNLWEENPENLELLKLVAMAFSSLDDFDSAMKVNEELIERVPTDVNAHLSRAIAMKGLGESQNALNELLTMATGDTYFSMDASGISKTLNREIRNLVFMDRRQLNTTTLDAKYLNNIKYKVRLIFEWNHPGAEFELQFVNPQKRFFNWKHTNTENRQRLEDEIKRNYRVEEFEFNGNEVTGKWIINARALQDFPKESGIPFVIKCTIYQDFGYPTQHSEDILVNFTKNNEKKNIKTLMVD